MKPEAQRIAIAEWIKSQGGKLEVVISDFGAEYETLPDLDDLNVIHEIEKILPALPYLYRLQEVCEGEMNTTGELARIIKATAAQRAEALLRTIGKWIDDA